MNPEKLQQIIQAEPPYLVVYTSDGLPGLGLRGNEQIVAVVDDDTQNDKIGRLPTDIVTDPPHIINPIRTGTSEKVVPFADAPERYQQQIGDDLVQQNWMSFAQQLVEETDAEPIEATILSISVVSDYYGPSEIEYMRELTGWPTQLIHDVFDKLHKPNPHTPRRARYLKQLYY